MKNTPFLQELTEARLYKGADTLKGKSAKQIANIVFMLLTTLEIMRHEDPTFAKKYVENTLNFGNFEHMRSSSSDMANLIAVLNNQDEYDDYIQSDPGIAIPFLQLKRYLNDIRFSSPKKTHSIDVTFFLRLEEFLKISDSVFKYIRRGVTHWDTLQDSEKKSVVENLRREFNNRSNYNDLYLHFKSVLSTY